MSYLLVICLGWCSNFVASESGQKQSVKLLQNMVYTTILNKSRHIVVGVFIVHSSMVFTLFDIVESAKRLTKLMKIQKMMGFKVRLC